MTTNVYNLNGAKSSPAKTQLNIVTIQNLQKPSRIAALSPVKKQMNKVETLLNPLLKNKLIKLKVNDIFDISFFVKF
jgi:hypothetical protein